MAKLLLVEDDNNLREIYEARLQAEGYTIVSAKDGEEALVVAKAEKPDLVISDVMMPKISGFEMLDILRNTPEMQGVKIIMLTALGQSDDQQRADKLGADRYLVKSQVTLEDIVKTTHELLGDETGPEATPPAPEAAATAVPSTPPASADSPDAGPPAPVAAAPQTPAPAPPATPPVNVPPPAPPVATPTPAPAPPPVPGPAPSAAPVPTPPAVPEAPPAAEPAPTPAPSADTKPQEETGPDAAKPDIDQGAAKNKSNGAAESTVQEEADVEAKIEDFVSGASTEPTTPSTGDEPVSVKPVPDMGETTPADTVPATSSQDHAADAVKGEPVTAPKDKSASTASDDKLMADAVDTLVASTDTDAIDTKAAPAPQPTVIPVATEPASQPAPAPDDSDKPDIADDSDDGNSSVPINHKKVIKPLDTPLKKDINALLAEEEAKEAQTTPGSTIVAGDTEEDRPAGSPMAPPSSAAESVLPAEPKPDPGSIAL